MTDKALPEYREVFSGRLVGLLQWDQFERLWQWLAANPEGWYVRDFSSSRLPEDPMPAEAFRDFLAKAEDFLRRRHREEYCGFLYADHAEAPVFIKVFDPRKMGSACGCSGRIVPRWTISRMHPQPVPGVDDTEQPESGTASRMSFLRRLFG